MKKILCLFLVFFMYIPCAYSLSIIYMQGSGVIDQRYNQQGQGSKGFFIIDSGETHTAFGQPMYFTADGELEHSDANDPNSPCNVILLETGTGSKLCALPLTLIRNSALSLTMGKSIYLSEDPSTGAGLTHIKPTTSGSIVQYLGECFDDPNEWWFAPEHQGELNP